ncbi:hypothetical protein D3C79_755040 [compost metagenome]
MLLQIGGQAGQLVVIGTGHLSLLGAGELLPLRDRLPVSQLGGLQRGLPFQAPLAQGADALIEIAKILQ